jgi:hypothetical protein
MAEFSLDGWTAADRESLSFLLDDAGITARWGPNEIEVPEESRDRVQRFIDFLNNKYNAELETAAADGVTGEWNLTGPGLGSAADTRYFDVASPWLRIGGSLIDGFVFVPLALLLLAVGAPRFGLLYWLQVVVGALYQILMVGLLGRTVGNMVVRTRVVTLTERAIPGLHAGFIRWIVAASVPILLAPWPGLFGIELLWSLIVFGPVFKGPSHRGLHDRAAGVMVLDDRLAPVRRHPTPSTDVV